MALQDNADTLIYSDDPEQLAVVADVPNDILVATPKDAILVSSVVQGGTKRVFYYHVNADPDPRTLGVRLLNTGEASANLNFITYSQVGSKDDAATVGHQSVVNFLRALSTAAPTWTPLTLAAGEETAVAVTVPTFHQLSSTFLELQVPDGAEIKIEVITANAVADFPIIGRNGPPAPHDGVGRQGVFDLTNNGAMQGDYAAVNWAAGSPNLTVSVPSVDFPNRQRPPVKPPHILKPGVYGIFTRRNLTLTNATENAVDADVYIQADGGGTCATCMIDNDIIELGMMSSGTSGANRPGYGIASFTIPPNNTGDVTFDVMATVDPSGSGPLKIVVAPADSLPAPPPGQVVFMPGGPPWQP